MSSLRDIPQTAGNGCRNSYESVFRCNFLFGRWSRRYTMAILLFLLLIIEQCRNSNVLFALVGTAFEISGVHYNAIGEWSLDEVDRLVKVGNAITTIAQVPGAIFIYKVSSHNYLVTSVVISSILHMLTPIGLHHHSVFLIILLAGETIISASIRNAAISMWKSWAPPAERTHLIMFCFLPVFVDCATAPYFNNLFEYFMREEHFYITGTAGLLWAIFWYCSSFGFPENDPLISDKELRYLQDSIPAMNQLKIRISDIPWKSILTSKQVYLLCLVLFKMGCSIQTIYIGTVLTKLHLSFHYDTFWMFLIFSLALVLVPLCTGRLADKLMTKFDRKKIRLQFLCGGLLLHCLCLIATLSPAVLCKGIFFILAYIFFAASLPGFVTMAFDLSARYVSSILGVAFTAYYAALVIQEYFMESTLSLMDLDSLGWLFLLDGIISLLCVIFFYLYADYTEQPWSFIPFENSCRTDDIRENAGGLSQIHEEA